MSSRWTNDFLRHHERVAHLDEQGNGFVEYVRREEPLVDLRVVGRASAVRARWPLAIAAVVAWLLILYHRLG